MVQILIIGNKPFIIKSLQSFCLCKIYKTYDLRIKKISKKSLKCEIKILVRSGDGVSAFVSKEKKKNIFWNLWSRCF
jgi:hypothetical protein